LFPEKSKGGPFIFEKKNPPRLAGNHPGRKDKTLLEGGKPVLIGGKGDRDEEDVNGGLCSG